MASGTTEDLRNETNIGESGVLGGVSAERQYALDGAKGATPGSSA
jgi:hypothetical protein